MSLWVSFSVNNGSLHERERWVGLGLVGLVGLGRFDSFFVLFLFFHFCFFNSVLNSFNYLKHSFDFKSLSKFVWI